MSVVRRSELRFLSTYHFAKNRVSALSSSVSCPYGESQAEAGCERSGLAKRPLGAPDREGSTFGKCIPGFPIFPPDYSSFL
jgi:hypothetical protein